MTDLTRPSLTLGQLQSSPLPPPVWEKRPVSRAGVLSWPKPLPSRDSFVWRCLACSLPIPLSRAVSRCFLPDPLAIDTSPCVRRSWNWSDAQYLYFVQKKLWKLCIPGEREYPVVGDLSVWVLPCESVDLPRRHKVRPSRVLDDRTHLVPLK